MKIFKTIILLILFLINISFLFKVENSEEYFKTFNEYQVKAIPFAEGEDKNRDVFIRVKNYLDTIKVQISNDLGNPIFYINKGEYWLSIKEKYNTVSENTSVTYYKEKRIFNDTILIYDYMINHYGDTASYFGSGDIKVETKSTTLIFSYDRLIALMILNGDKEKYYNGLNLKNVRTRMTLNDEEERYRFETLRKLVRNYKDIFIQKKSPYIVSPIIEYNLYCKEIKNDTLFIYSKDGIKNQPFCLYDVRLLNSLGEFDPKRGKSIIGKIDLDKRCR